MVGEVKVHERDLCADPVRLIVENFDRLLAWVCKRGLLKPGYRQRERNRSYRGRWYCVRRHKPPAAVELAMLDYLTELEARVIDFQSAYRKGEHD